MRDVFGRIHRALVRVIPDLDRLEPGDSRRSRRPPFMDLHLDVLCRLDVQPAPVGLEPYVAVALSHTFVQNGDVMADPDMEIRVFATRRMAEARTFQQSSLGLFRVVYPEPGLVDVAAKRDLNAFLLMWLRNAYGQGHRLDANARVSVDAGGA